MSYMAAYCLPAAAQACAHVMGIRSSAFSALGFGAAFGTGFVAAFVAAAGPGCAVGACAPRGGAEAISRVTTAHVAAIRVVMVSLVFT
jgi:hypothetical protein